MGWSGRTLLVAAVTATVVGAAVAGLAEAGPIPAVAAALALTVAGLAAAMREDSSVDQTQAAVDRLADLLEETDGTGAAAEQIRRTLSDIAGAPVILIRRDESGTWVDSDGVALDPDALIGRSAQERLARAAQICREDDLRRDHDTEVERWLAQNQSSAVIPFARTDALTALALVPSVPIGEATFDALDRVRELGEEALRYSAALERAETHLATSEEVDLAAEIQRRFVPAEDDMRVSSVQLSGIYWPASQCCGDWWAAYPLSRERSLIVIGDVTGHGLPSAMVTAAAIGTAHAMVEVGSEGPSPEDLLLALDRSVRHTGADRFYMTCVACLVDPRAGEVLFANAGHLPPYLAPREQAGLKALVARGNPLGAGARPSIGTGHMRISAGDRFVWYTDGIVECTNASADPFGERRFQRLLRRNAPSAETPRALRDILTRGALDHTAGHPLGDDVTLVVGQVG